MPAAPSSSKSEPVICKNCTTLIDATPTKPLNRNAGAFIPTPWLVRDAACTWELACIIEACWDSFNNEGKY